ncbi:MAG: hypothetical protein ABI595_14805 [Actinomycetota bacterium]
MDITVTDEDGMVIASARDLRHDAVTPISRLRSTASPSVTRASGRPTPAWLLGKVPIFRRRSLLASSRPPSVPSFSVVALRS